MELAAGIEFLIFNFHLKVDRKGNFLPPPKSSFFPPLARAFFNNPEDLIP